MPKPNILQVTRRMWHSVLRHPEWKASAFVAYASDNGLPLDKAQLSRMHNGQRRTCSDTLMLLAGFLGNTNMIYGPYQSMLELEPEPESDEDLVSPDVAVRALIRAAADVNDASAAEDPEALHDALSTVRVMAVSLQVYVEHLDEAAS